MNITGIEDRGTTGRIAIYQGSQRIGYRSATKAYQDLTGERIRWPELRGKLHTDRSLTARLIVAAHDQYEPKATTTGPNLAAWVENFLQDKREARSAPATVAALEAASRILIAALGGDKPVSSITQEDARTLRRRLMASDGALKACMKSRRSSRPWSINGAATLLRRCKAIVQPAVDNGIITRNPFSGVSVTQTPPKNRTYVSAAEVREVIDRITGHDRDAWVAGLVLARWAGARRSELMAVTHKDIDREARTVRLHQNKTKRAPRIVPVSGGVLVQLPDGKPDKPLVDLSIGQAAQIRATLGVPWSWQTLRSAWATDAANSASSMAAYAAAAGHSPTVAMKHYLSIRDCDADSLRI